ncbi:Mariner Mos1 transposase [Folsomia candida]|uniref:Mariner Mos1 transposase n=1 Tax=Folsomia candida TaxID=158441 RepID=A0A226DT19_FOLCA|nr:Mariner Mos1 transposase [Folsomia candida]
MPQKLQPEWEGRVLALSDLNYSTREVRKLLLTQNIVISQKTINNIVNCVGKRRRAKSAGQKSPTKRQRLNDANRKAVKKIDLLTRKENPPFQKQIANIVGIPRTSVQRIIKRLGKRIAFKTTKYLAGDKAEYVVTLDEAMFYVQNCNGKRKVCYVKRGEKIPENWVVQKDNFLKKHMVVAAMTGREVIPLFQVPKKVKVNADWYIDKVLRPLVNIHLPRIYGHELHKVVIHHDKASSHTSHKTAIYAADIKRSKGITIIPGSEIPVKSSDISPLDFFGFGYLKQRLSRRRARTWKGVWKVLNKEWKKVTPELCTKVFKAWKRRLRLVAKSDGRHIENNRTFIVENVKVKFGFQMHLPVSGMHSGVSKLELGLNVSHHLPLEEDTCLANFQARDWIRMPFQLNSIREAMKIAAKFGLVTVGETITGATAVLILNDIVTKLAHLGGEGEVRMEDFLNAAARCGFSREVGLALYNVMGLLT